MRSEGMLLGTAGVLALTLLMFTAALAAPQKQSADQKSNQKTSASGTSAGERKFATHCGRCHNPPQEISPKAVPAVLRHMRVRAMLTAEDEKAILEFMAP